MSQPRYLAQMLTATLLVAICPVAIVWSLRASGAVDSLPIGLALGVGLALGASWLGRAVWQRRPGSEDVLFSELLIWGYVHRWLSERRLASARDLLGPMNRAQRGRPGGLSAERQARLLSRLAARMDARDPHTHGHSRRVARHSWMIARRMGLPREEVARIRTAAAIHDVGKVDTPMSILRKPGALTDAEYAVIKRHPEDGARMVSILHDPGLTAIVRHHHERLDGSGYPDGLCGEDIPIGARIIAVADTFDAIVSSRPYRPARPHSVALDILRKEAGTQLDPAAVRAFTGHYTGSRPLTLWASLAALPERAVSWLGGSLTGVASAAKVMTVAALIGGAAAGSASLALPAARHGDGAQASVQAATLPGPALHAGLAHTPFDTAQALAGASAGTGLPTVTTTGASGGGQAAAGPGGGAGQASAGGQSSLAATAGATTTGPGGPPAAQRTPANRTTGSSGHESGKGDGAGKGRQVGHEGAGGKGPAGKGNGSEGTKGKGPEGTKGKSPESKGNGSEGAKGKSPETAHGNGEAVAGSGSGGQGQGQGQGGGGGQGAPEGAGKGQGNPEPPGKAQGNAQAEGSASPGTSRALEQGKGEGKG